MLDDFREQANASELYEGEETPSLEDSGRSPQKRFLGMTPAQRFVIALLLLMMTCILSTFCLLAMEKIIPPFL